MCEYKSIYIYIYVCVCVCVFEIFALFKQFSLLLPHRKKVPFNLIKLQDSFINMNVILRNTVKREQPAKPDRFSVVLEVCVFTSVQSRECKLRSLYRGYVSSMNISKYQNNVRDWECTRNR